MEFIETSFFTRRILKFLSDDEYRRLQATLIERPDAGVTIPGGGGLRKLRWKVSGKGKRGGPRLIYYWVKKDGIILFLHAFTKAEAKDLRCDVLSDIRKLVEEWIK